MCFILRTESHLHGETWPRLPQARNTGTPASLKHACQPFNTGTPPYFYRYSVLRNAAPLFLKVQLHGTGYECGISAGNQSGGRRYGYGAPTTNHACQACAILKVSPKDNLEAGLVLCRSASPRVSGDKVAWVL